MPDSHKALGQNVQQKAANKLDSFQGYRFGFLRFSILNRKAHPSILKGQDSIVGDGHPVGVAGKVFQHILRPINGLPNIHHPVAPVALTNQFIEAAPGAERLCLTRVESHL